MGFSIVLSPEERRAVHTVLHQIEIKPGETLHKGMIKALQAFGKYRKSLPPGNYKRALSWVPADLLSETPPVHALRCPLKLSEETFALGKTGDAWYPTWGGLGTCLCPKTSPEGIDLFADQVAADLQGETGAILIDFGANEALPSLSLLTRLRSQQFLKLMLVDPKYSVPREGSVKGVFLRGQVAGNLADKIPFMNSFIKHCQALYPESSRNVLTVQVFSTHTALVEALSKTSLSEKKHVLYSVDPAEEGTYARDFQQVAKYLSDNTKQPGFYCLNQCKAVGTARITNKEALVGDLYETRPS